MKWTIRIVSILTVLAVLVVAAGAVNVTVAVANGNVAAADYLLGDFILVLVVIVPLSLTTSILTIVDAARNGRGFWTIILLFAPILEIAGGYALASLPVGNRPDVTGVIAESLFWFVPLIVPVAALAYSFWSAPRKPHVDKPPSGTAAPE